MKKEILELCQCARVAALELTQAKNELKNSALFAMAAALDQQRSNILAANEMDLAKTQASSAFLDRLRLNPERIDNLIQSILAIAKLPDPVGKVLASWTVTSGLKISRISVPLGVLGIIYESRPNVTTDAGALALKSGNTAILRGGSEAEQTNKILTQCLQLGLNSVNLTKNCIQYLPDPSRAAVDELIKMDQYIDVLIPRGGKSLIEYLTEHSRIPMFKHLEGLCHSYIHKDAEETMALRIVQNAKMRRTGICGATETILVDREIAKTLLPKLVANLIEANCEIRGDEMVQAIDTRVIAASVADWSTEYLDAIVAIKVVNDFEAALTHIETYSSKHTDAIITDNAEIAAAFLKRVNSAIVMHNCSTQFADGGEFGMGAEIGIATGKLHARGPVGLEQLTTFKYCVEGHGEIRS